MGQHNQTWAAAAGDAQKNPMVICKIPLNHVKSMWTFLLNSWIPNAYKKGTVGTNFHSCGKQLRRSSYAWYVYENMTKKIFLVKFIRN